MDINLIPQASGDEEESKESAGKLIDSSGFTKQTSDLIEGGQKLAA